MHFRKIFIVLAVLNSSLIFSQWNIQAGYDFGLIKLPSVNTETFNEKYSFNGIHRLTILSDYRFEKNVLFGFGLGYDVYARNKESSQKIFIETNNSCEIKTSTLNADFNVFRLEFYMGV